MRKSFDSVIADSRPSGGVIKQGDHHVVAEAGNKGANDPNTWGQGPQVPSIPPQPPVTGSDSYPSSSPRIASEFMAQGRPPAEGLQASGARPGDITMGLEILTPQPGMGFKEWAMGGYDKNGCTKSGPQGAYNYDKTPGTPAVVKANIPGIVKNQ
jgi:hypothetical protein